MLQGSSRDSQGEAFSKEGRLSAVLNILSGTSPPPPPRTPETLPVDRLCSDLSGDPSGTVDADGPGWFRTGFAGKQKTRQNFRALLAESLENPKETLRILGKSKGIIRNL